MNDRNTLMLGGGAALLAFLLLRSKAPAGPSSPAPTPQPPAPKPPAPKPPKPDRIPGKRSPAASRKPGSLPAFPERTGVLDPRLAQLTTGWVWPVEVLTGTAHPEFASPGQRRLVHVSNGWHKLKTGRWHLGGDLTFLAKAQKQQLPERARRADMPTGMRCLSVGPGRVSLAKQIGTGGYVRIHHPQAGLVSQYMHLATLTVKAGDVVKAGQPIGLVGHPPTGYKLNHLHFELILAALEMHLDPEPYLQRWGHVLFAPDNSTERIIT